MPDKKFISMGEAVRRVGQARFREKWIAGLTDEECEAWEGGPLDFPGEYEAAQRRIDRLNRQYEWAEDWLYERCFTKQQRAAWDRGPYQPDRRRGHDFRFDRSKFERLLASQFAVNEASEQNAPEPRKPVARKEVRDSERDLPPRRRGPNREKSNRAAEALKRLLREGKITRSQLINSVADGGLKREDIAKRIGIGRTTARSVIELVLSEPEFADGQSATIRDK